MAMLAVALSRRPSVAQIPRQRHPQQNCHPRRRPRMHRSLPYQRRSRPGPGISGRQRRRSGRRKKQNGPIAGSSRTTKLEEASEELALPLQMHDELRLERLGVCVRRRGAGRGITRLVALDAASAVSRRPPANRSAFARHASIALLHLVVIAGLHLTLSEPARAADAKADECGIASVYSTLSGRRQADKTPA